MQTVDTSAKGHALPQRHADHFMHADTQISLACCMLAHLTHVHGRHGINQANVQAPISSLFDTTLQQLCEGAPVLVMKGIKQ